LFFTGHRDKLAKISELDRIHNLYPESVWIEGGADGFDKQVKQFGESKGHLVIEVKPDYKTYKDKPKFAPVARNRDMIHMLSDGDIVVALYDGRPNGGTKGTIDYATLCGYPIIYLEIDNE
jgi:hypothetical protein